MKLLFLIIFSAFSCNLFAADTVRINDPANLVVTAVTSASFIMGSDVPSGDATSEAAPARIYIPIQTSVVNELNFSTLKISSGLTTLLDITNPLHTITYPLLITASVTGNSKTVYAAVKLPNTTTYYIVAQSGTFASSVSNSYFSFNLTPQDICKASIANTISSACSPGTGALIPTSATGGLFKPMVYFFIAEQGLGVTGTTTTDPTNSSSAGGVFFESQMSNQVQTTIVVSLDSLRKGDGRVIGTFSSNTPMDSNIFKKVIVYKYVDANTAININQSVGAAALANPGSILSNDISTAQSGEFTLSGLPNSYRVNISLAFEDKFLFATTLSTSRSEVPTEIQELLKKQACYLLTAGFGEEHYVITFFRGYRDQILANSWLGKQFIKVYYRSAPHYAVIIYQSEWMRLVIRSMAYTLYFFFNYYWLVLIFLVAWLFLNLWKNKILLQKNSL